MAQTKKDHPSKFLTWLSPSWLSGLITITVSLAMIIGIIITFSLKNSGLGQQLAIWQITAPQPVLTLPGQSPAVVNNSLSNSWPLLVFWAAIGLVVFYLVEAIARFVKTERETLIEMHYIHARRQRISKAMVEFLLFRLAVIILWLIYANLFLKQLLPSAITAANIAATDLKSLSGLLYSIGAVGLLAIGLHIHVLFCRLLYRRTRLFSANFA